LDCLGLTAFGIDVIEEPMGPDATNRLATILVDLTPVLPGGENGGAKVFVLELLKQLAELAPETQFILLTQAASHQELTALDRSNVERVLLIGDQAPLRAQSFLVRTAARFLNRVPRRAAAPLRRLGYRLRGDLKRHASASVLQNLHGDLLFCPFTAPTYAEATTPTVSVIYDLQYRAYPQFFSSNDVVHRERTFAEACSRSTMLAAISEFSRREAIAEGGLDPEKIKTIYLQISSHRLRSSAADTTILERLGLREREYLIYPANFWKHKNHEMLLTAFAMAHRDGLPDHIKLVCTGAPNSRQEEVRRAAIDFGLGNHVILPGFLDDAELLALIINSTGIVFPSLYEGFGLPVIEAMAVGVPVACSNAGSLPEVAQGAAILFDPRQPEQIASAILTLTNDRDITDRLVAAGSERAALFSDSREMAKQYWELFQQAVDLSTDCISGVYLDGWAGPSVNLRLAQSNEPRILAVELSLPSWAPQDVTVRAWTAEGQALDHIVERNSRATLSIPVDSKGGRHRLEIAPTFVPADWGLGDDHRTLSVMLEQCVVTGDSGSPSVLHAKRGSNEG
jgi:glycosyltransferase involved in cell wall biosynthesis